MSMKLTVQKLPEFESYLGIVRVGAAATNISPGDYIVISGKRNTCARVWKAGRRWCYEHAGSAGSEMIWMDEFTAKNAGIRFGEKVFANQISPRTAEFVELSCREKLSDHTVLSRLLARSEGELIKIVTRKRAVSAGETMVVRGISTNLPVVFRVLKTIPKGFVVIGEETEIEVKQK